MRAPFERSLAARGALALDRRHVAWVPLALLLLAMPAMAREARVKQNTNLRPSPSATEAPIRLLTPPAKVTVLDPAPENGYLHVKAGKDEGWVYARNVTTVRGKTAKPYAARVASAKRKKAASCATSLNDCPVFGCEKEGSPHGLLNAQKRTLPPQGTPITLTFEQLQRLQAATDESGIHGGDDLTTRSDLKEFDIGGVSVGEGRLVQVTGFIAPERKLQPAGPESVNCRLSKAAENDIHIPIVEEPDGTEYESVVVEPIPEHPIGITIALLKQLQQDGTRLLIRGQLMLDNLHRINDDPEHPQNGQPKRFTIWELHPVTTILVCARTDNDCNVNQPDQWAAANE